MLAVPLLRVIILGLYLSACTAPTAAPTSAVTPSPANLLPATSLSATESPISSTNTPEISTLTVQPSLTLVSATPTCAAPAGWVSYTIRPGDNLFRLGVKTNTSVDEIKLANCLTEDVIVAGDPLYLPFTPPTDVPAPAAPISASPIPASPCPSVFNCSQSGLPGYTVGLGGGNESTNYIPCESPSNTPWIDTAPPYDADQRPVMSLGERRYFFTCDFTSNPVSALVRAENRPDDPVSLLDPATVNRDLLTGSPTETASKVIEWAAIPVDGFSGPMTYTLIITDESGTETSLPFTVKLPAETEKHILVTPHSGSPGTTFQVYYVNFDLNPATTFYLYGEDQPPGDRCSHRLSYRGQWTVPITKTMPGSSSKGWAQASLASSSSDPRAAYSVNYSGQDIKCSDLFWLH